MMGLFHLPADERGIVRSDAIRQSTNSFWCCWPSFSFVTFPLSPPYGR